MWLAIVATLASSPTEAPRESWLRWEAPAGCPDERAVQQRAIDLMSAAAIDPALADVRASARVHATPFGFVLDLHVEGGRAAGDRRIDAEDCDELAHAAALIFTIAIEPPPGDTSPAEPEPSLAAPPAVEPRAPASTRTPARVGVAPHPRGAAADADGPRRRLGFGLRAGAGIDAGLWRPVGLSTMLGGVLVGRGYRVELTARYAAPSTIQAASNSQIEAVGQQWSVGVGACWSPAFERVRQLAVPLCGSLEAGLLHAQGQGTSLNGHSNHAPWLATAFGAGVAWLFASRVALFLSGEAVILLARPRFVTDQGTVVLETRRAGFRLLAGLELRFGGGR